MARPTRLSLGKPLPVTRSHGRGPSESPALPLPPGTTTALSPTATPRRPSPPSRAATSCGARTSSPSTCASGGAGSSVGGTTRTWVSQGAQDVARARAPPGALRQESAELLPCCSAQCEAAELPFRQRPAPGPPACRRAQPRALGVGRHCRAVPSPPRLASLRERGDPRAVRPRPSALRSLQPCVLQTPTGKTSTPPPSRASSTPSTSTPY